MRLVGLLLGLAPTALTLAIGGWRQHQWRQSYVAALSRPPEQREGLLLQAVERARSPFVAPEHLLESLQAQAETQERLGSTAAARDALQTAAYVRSALFRLDGPRARALRELALLDHLAHDREAEVEHRRQLLYEVDDRLQVDRDTLARDTFDYAEAVAAQGHNREWAASLYEQAHALWRRVPTSDQVVRATLGLARLTLNRGDLKMADHLYAEALDEGLDGVGDALARCDALRQALLAKRLLGLDGEASALRSRFGQACPGANLGPDALAQAEALIASERQAQSPGAATGNLGRAELTLLAISEESAAEAPERLASAWFGLAQAYASAELNHEAVAALDEALARSQTGAPAWHSEALRLRGNCRLRALGPAGASQAVADLRAAREAYLESKPTSGFLELSLELAEAQLKASDLEGAVRTLQEVAPPIRTGRDAALGQRLDALLSQAGVRSAR